MKNTKWLVLAGIAILMMTVGCEKQMGFVAPEEDYVSMAASGIWEHAYGGGWGLYFHWLPSGPTTYSMSLGQDDGNNAQVTLWVEGTGSSQVLKVEYVALNGWEMSQTHFAIATTKAGIPNNKGGMIPGKFPYGEDYDPRKTRDTLEIDWDQWLAANSGWNGTDSLFVAAHGVFWKEMLVNGVMTWVTQTGWGGEKQFKIPSLPDECVHLTVGPNGWPRCYFWTTLSGVPVVDPPYNVWNSNDWAAWCGQKGPGTGTGINYDVHLYSVFDYDIPNIALYKDPDWPKIGWLLNHWKEYTGATSVEVQNVIWYELGYIPKPTSPPVAQQMATDADTHLSWRPSTGEIVPVICHPCVPNNYQLLFIEVDP